MRKNNDKTGHVSLEETKEFWSKRCDREISLEDAREIENNLVEFFSILIEWDEQDRKSSSECDETDDKESKNGTF